MASTRFGLNVGKDNSQVVKNQTEGTSHVEIRIDRDAVKNKLQANVVIQKIVDYINEHSLI